MQDLTKKKYVYFDNAATTKILDKAQQAVLNTMNFNFANPSSLHKFGLNAEKILNTTRNTIASSLNCQPDEIVFTSSATLSTNIAILGSMQKFYRNTKKKIITTAIEHAATKNCLKYLENHGFEIIKIQPSNKIYSANDFIKQIDNNTCLISLIHVNNETGLILPIEEITKLAKLKNSNALIHIDCVQSFTKLPINLTTMPADFVSISGHKINAPKGVGVLFIRKNTKINPIFFGGGQENGIFPGTQNVPAIAGLNTAVKFHIKNSVKHLQHYKNLKNELIKICKTNPKIKFNFEADKNVPYIINISIKKINAQVMLNFLEMHGFLVSSASACSKGHLSTVLTNLGYSSERQQSAIRISLSFNNTMQQVQQLANTILKGAETLLH